MSSASFRLHHSDGRLLRQNQPFSDEINPSLRRNQPFLSIVHHQMNPKTFFSPPFSKTFLCLLEGEDAHILSETKEEVVRAYVDFVKAHFSFEGNFDCMNDMHLHCYKLEHLPALVAGIWTDDNNMQFQATTQFRKFLSIERSPPIEEVIQAGVAPCFS
ncbi:hypothetical protein P8452_50443 [Trifolium repens]|nr:hypothetical protein P8452_50443 [Trifolium repens]